MECAAKPNCTKLLRRYVMQVVMLGWGIFGISQSPAGMFLAFHHSLLGPYFGDDGGHTWPHNPFNNTPTELEETFNDKMVEITDKFTKGKLKELSFLEFAGIGNSVPDFDRNQTQITTWQNQLNFAIYEAMIDNGNNTRNLFITYKKLNEEWNAYVKDSRDDEIEAEYNLEWNNNPYFNFSNYIREDMKSFLQVVHGSWLVGEDHTLADPPYLPYRRYEGGEPASVWNETAQQVFTQRRDKEAYR